MFYEQDKDVLRESSSVMLLLQVTLTRHIQPQYLKSLTRLMKPLVPQTTDPAVKPDGANKIQTS